MPPTSTPTLTPTNRPAPSITNFSPPNGVVGATVTINGANFTGATAVTFNGTSAGFTFIAANKITATVPAGATTKKISVTTPGGTATSAGNFTVKPGITGFTPGSGDVGTPVTITGTTFAGATSVKFNGTAATLFTVDSDMQITATVPANATTGTITVTTPGGTATSATSFIVAPRITSYTPANDPVGANVTINGANFIGATSVKFNGTPAVTFTVNHSNKITAKVPAGATTGTITVTTPAGTATSATNFIVTFTPAITNIAPPSGAVSDGVTITGTNFTGTTQVKFNGTAATLFTVDLDTQITATVPANATSGPITVTNSAGTATSASSFIVAPRITTFAPAHNPAGTNVTINGANFTGATSVKFNGTPAVIFTVNNSNKIAATVPAGATTGKITVTTPAGTAISANNFVVP